MQEVGLDAQAAPFWPGVYESVQCLGAGFLPSLCDFTLVSTSRLWVGRGLACLGLPFGGFTGRLQQAALGAAEAGVRASRTSASPREPCWPRREGCCFPKPGSAARCAKPCVAAEGAEELSPDSQTGRPEGALCSSSRSLPPGTSCPARDPPVELETSRCQWRDTSPQPWVVSIWNPPAIADSNLENEQESETQKPLQTMKLTDCSC
ncbi:unnamed protein product [Caretta caretta]